MTAMKLLKKTALGVDGEQLLDAAHLMNVCSWKCDRRVVHKVFNTKRKLENRQGDKIQDDKEPDDDEYTKSLKEIRAYFRACIARLIRLAFLPSTKDRAKFNEMPDFNFSVNVILTQVFCSGAGFGDFPWIDSFIINFRAILKSVWLLQDAPEKIELPPFTYPTTNDKAKEPSSFKKWFPPLDKDAKCDVCGKIIRDSNPGINLYLPIESAWSRNMSGFPREILIVAGERYSVGLACSGKCVFENEKVKFPELKKLSELKDSETENIENLNKMVQNESLRYFVTAYFIYENDNPRWRNLKWEKREDFLGEIDGFLFKSSEDKTKKAQSKSFFSDFEGIGDPMFSSKSLKTEFDSDKHACVMKYRKDLCELYSPKDKQTISEITLVWKKSWAAVNEFAKKDHSIKVKVQFCSSFYEYQPSPLNSKFCSQDIKSSLRFTFESKETLIFPADNKFFNMKNYKQSIKFVISGATNDSQLALRLLLSQNDYLVFVHNFDFSRQQSFGGFMYYCSKHDVIIGVCILNMYDHLMEGYGLNSLTTAYQRYQVNNFDINKCKPRDDDEDFFDENLDKFRFKPNFLHPSRKALYFVIRLVAIRNILNETKKEIKFPLLVFRTLFVYKTRNYQNEPFTIVFSTWRYGKSPDHLSYVAECLDEEIKDLNVENNSELLPETIRSKIDMDNTIVNTISVDAKHDLSNFTFYNKNSWILFENELNICRLTLVVKVTQPHQTFKHLVTFSDSISSLIKDLHDNFGCSKPLLLSYNKSGKNIFNVDVSQKVTPRYLEEKFSTEITSLRLEVSQDAGDKSKDILLNISTAPPIKKTKPSEPKRFLRSSFDDAMINHGTPMLLWKGTLNVVIEKQRDITFQNYAWISIISGEGDDCAREIHNRFMLGQNDLHRHIMMNSLDFCTKAWGDELHCAVVDDRDFLDAVDKSRVMCSADSLLVTFAPPWNGYENSREANSKLCSMLSYTRQNNYSHEKPKSMAIIPYYTDRYEWIFMTISWDVEKGIVRLDVPTNFGLAGDVLKRLRFQAGLFKKPIQKCKFDFVREEKTFLRGALMGCVNKEPYFGLALAHERYRDFEFVDVLNNEGIFEFSNDNRDDSQGIYSSFLVESQTVNPILGDLAPKFFVDFYFGSEQQSDLMSIREAVLECYLVLIKLELEALDVFIELKNWKHISDYVILIRIDSKSYLDGFLVDVKTRMKLAKAIFGGNSAAYNLTKKKKGKIVAYDCQKMIEILKSKPEKKETKKKKGKSSTQKAGIARKGRKT